MTHKSFLTHEYVLFCPFLIFLRFICTFSFCVMCMCTQYWCWSYVFSVFAFFSYCLPGLFGSSSSQSVCYFLSLLRVYICVSVITSHRKVVDRHACTFILLDDSDESCAVFSVLILLVYLCSSFHGFVRVSCGGSESFSPFSVTF